MKRAKFKFQKFSRRQRMILNWWTDESPGKDMDGIIADGAIRSGKTVAMCLSFVLWAMTRFDGQNFAMCGKTIGAFRRNVLSLLKLMLWSRGYRLEDHRADNLLVISRKGRSNSFYIFGGRDERSQDLVQGITLAGAFFDEVALMPESFVSQATARCSVEGSKYWFNCNPAGPTHWFKINWIDRCKEKRLLYLHFTMEDNLSLSETIKDRYRSMYVGVFFKRYIEGLWAVAEGLIYTMCTDANYYADEDRPPALLTMGLRTISVDYGTANPTVFLDIYDDGETIWVDREYRWDSRSDEARATGSPQRTDAQYADDMEEFMGRDPQRVCTIVVDPSAASFIATLRERGFVVKPAQNEVLDGIRAVSALLAGRKLRINRKRCPGLVMEMQSYAWNDKAVTEHGEEKPIKQLDHGPDALRYYVMTALPKWRRSA